MIVDENIEKEDQIDYIAHLLGQQAGSKFRISQFVSAHVLIIGMGRKIRISKQIGRLIYILGACYYYLLVLI